ncbi:FUSC family protein [Saccharopolyspora rectivirgula]|jgi:uncharacterized membrane protein YccC|nr:FUSC family protein [Saccharopolyspora rectivirgula]
MRERLATRTGAPDPRQRQYTALALTAVVGGTALGWLPELRTPVLLAALTTVLALVGTHGHSLRSDIRRFAWFAPALVLVMTIGPLLSAVPLLAGLLVALVVFGTGMLPALGEQYRISGQTFAAATLLATTTGLGSDQPPLVLLGSSAAGAAFALVLRVLTGLTDPTRPARFAVSRTLLEPGPGVVEEAAAAWRTDGSRTWLGQVLAGAARFRAARETLLAQAQQSDRIEAERLNLIVAEADEIAAELAKSVQAKVCTGLPAPARRNPAHISVPAGHEQPAAVQGLIDALDRIRTAVLRRTDIPTAPAHPGAVREKLLGAARAHLSFKSSLFRHALRCTLAVALGMVVVLLLQDPSAAPLLLGLYLVLQPAARDSMTGALERTGGAVLGVAALALLITLLPSAYLLIPLTLGFMMLNIEWLRRDYQLLLACLILITVVDQAMQLDRPLANVAISFAANTAVGAAIALGVGYVSYLVLPSSTLPDIPGAVRSTVWAVSELLRSVKATSRGAELPNALQAAHVLALRRTQDLLGLPALLDGTGEETDDDHSIRSAAVALDSLRESLATLAFRPESEREIANPALSAVDDLLGGKPHARVPDVPGESAPATEMLASSVVENALHARHAIDRIFGYDNPWKSYTISFMRTERLHIP